MKPQASGTNRPPRIHGRRRGHALRRGQQSLMDERLPRLRLDLAAPPDTERLFSRPAGDLWLEIGFGGGEHLAFQAKQHPEIGFIGCEPFINGLAKLLARAQADGLDNIRLHDQDARDLLAWLPDACLGRVFVLYPDPWPKKRHWKRRIIAPETVDQLARVMKPGAELRVASDIAGYVDWILRLVPKDGAFAWTARRPADWRRPFADWPGTRYEAKALREGRTPSYLTFVRRQRP